MKKVALLLLFAMSAAALTSPLIKASGSLLNQSSLFSQTLYTPNETGLFRITLYVETRTGSFPGSNSPSVTFTNAQGSDTAGCVMQGSNLTQNCIIVIRDLASDSIAVTLNPNTTLDFYWVVERIQ